MQLVTRLLLQLEISVFHLAYKYPAMSWTVKVQQALLELLLENNTLCTLTTLTVYSMMMTL